MGNSLGQTSNKRPIEMNRLFLILALIFVSLISNGQLQADSLLIYKDFQGRGTTANLWHYHHDADSLKTLLQKLSDNDLNTLKLLFASTKSKKYFQQKHGGKLLLGFIYLNGQKYKCAISNEPNYIHFVNLTFRKNLILRDSLKASQVNNILLKYSK